MPKLEDEKYFLVESFPNYQSGDLLILVAYKEKGSLDLLSNDQIISSQYKLFKINNKNMKVEEIASFDFAYPQYLAFANVVPDDQTSSRVAYGNKPILDLSLGNIMLVFSPAGGLLVSGKDKVKGNYSFYSINKFGEVELTFKKEVPSGAWNILEVLNKGEDYYFIGPAKRNRYLNTMKLSEMKRPDTVRTKPVKWEDFQIMKVSSGRVEFVSNTKQKEFNAKAVKPKGQWFFNKYKGKYFTPLFVTLSDQNNIFFCGQNFKLFNLNPYPVYKNVMLSHFNDKGKLITSYNYKIKGYSILSNAPSPVNLHFTNNGEKVFLETGLIGKVKAHKTLNSPFDILTTGNLTSVYSKQFKYYPSYALVDLNGKRIQKIHVPIVSDRRRLFSLNVNYLFIKLPNNNILYFGKVNNEFEMIKVNP